MQKIIMLKGLPGSGKRAWADSKVQQGGYIRIGVDDLRKDFFGGWSEKKEKSCLRMRDDLVRFAIKEGRSAIVDAPNLNPKHEYRLRALAEELGVPFIINDSFLKKTPEECIKEDLHRGKEAIGADAIYDLYEKWVRPNPVKIMKKDELKRRCIIVDLEGTLLSKTIDHTYEIKGLNENVPDFFISYILDCIATAGDYYADIIIISDRPANERKLVEDWLKDNCITYEHLYMRGRKDTRREVEVKEDILKGRILPNYVVLGVIDNSTHCDLMYYNQGISTLKAGNPRAER